MLILMTLKSLLAARQDTWHLLSHFIETHLEWKACCWARDCSVPLSGWSRYSLIWLPVLQSVGKSSIGIIHNSAIVVILCVCPLSMCTFIWLWNWVYIQWSLWNFLLQMSTLKFICKSIRFLYLVNGNLSSGGDLSVASLLKEIF